MIDTKVDVFIIGGGINGTAIAADAAGRGLSVALCEQNDLASGTSSASSKLIHGGLRYLETYEFRMVHQALREREILLKRAPQLIAPLEFILPHEKHLRPAWLIRLGLLLYDYLSLRKKLPHSTAIQFPSGLRGAGLLPHLQKGFSYYDCFTDDAKLVVLNALSAKNNGAVIFTHTECIAAVRETNGWAIELKNTLTQEHFFYHATALINVAGPWVKQVEQRISPSAQFAIELIKGSHIVVPRLYEGDFAYILQNKDQRIVFALPFHQQFTLIGTTDVIFENTIDHITISQDEQIYLCHLINDYFIKKISPQDICWSYAGVRCLQASTEDNPAKITRDYKLLLDEQQGLPKLTIIGGKLTTHRSLAEEAVNRLRPFFKKCGGAWTATKPLPGGDIPGQDLSQFKKAVKNKFVWLPDEMVDQYVYRYGTRVYSLLNEINSLNDLGEHFGHGLYQQEVEFLIQHEWAQSCDDILWRRTKLGLNFTELEKRKLEAWLTHYLTAVR